MMLLSAVLALSNLHWQQLPSLPDREGFAGMFGGVSHGVLLVAGGANFPEKKPWEGGKKIWYDQVFGLDRPSGGWKIVGRLPRALGYGVSASFGNKIVCVGGSDAERHYRDTFRIEASKKGLSIDRLSDLPVPFANGCGTIVGTWLYVVGGQEAPDSRRALARVFRMNLRAKSPAWTEIAPIPGPARILATVASLGGDLYVFGGVELIDGDAGAIARRYLKDAYRYHPATGWSRMPDLPRPVVAAPSPAFTDASGITVLGGDDGSKVGFQPPTKHPGFSSEILRYDSKRRLWSTVGRLPAPRVTTVGVRWGRRWVVPSGEMRPGVRSPEVWSFTRQP